MSKMHFSMKVRGSFSIMPLLMRAPAPEFILQCNKQHLGGTMQVTPLLQGGHKASLRQLSQEQLWLCQFSHAKRL